MEFSYVFNINTKRDIHKPCPLIGMLLEEEEPRP